MSQDVIELIQRDHQQVRQLLGQIEAADPDSRGELFHELVGELARHEAAEETIVHPTLRDEVDGGRAIADQVLEEESEAESLLARMEKMDPASDEFVDAFRSLRDDVLQHAEHEERQEHPKLREALSEQRREEMGQGWLKLKKTAPTRPHPHTPQTPEVRAAVGPVAGAFDRARDAARDLFTG